MTDAQAQIADPMIGTRIDDRYLVQGVLGRGGMAIVYEGIHEQLGRSVAIKVLSAGIALDPVLVERFLREARMASGLSHSNIVEVWDLGRLPDGRPYLVMPKLAGVDFSTFLEREGPQSPARVVELLSGVALALDFVHAKGLLHRDVKLENLMHIVREDGSEQVMLMDFGIATAATSNATSARLTDYGVVCGTPAYLPPEVAVGAVSDRRADVYALATVAFELMTGRLPFQSDDPLRILPLKATRDAPRMSEVTGHEFPEAIEDVVAQGLAFRPEHRYSRAGEFVAALEDAVLQSADELGVAGRPSERRSKHLFGRGSLHSALYRIPEREMPRSLAPAERVTDVESRRPKTSTPRARNHPQPAPRRGTLGTLGWLGCLALAALLAPVIWTAGRSGTPSAASGNAAPTREPVWQVRPNSASPAVGLESPGEQQAQELATTLQSQRDEAELEVAAPVDPTLEPDSRAENGPSVMRRAPQVAQPAPSRAAPAGPATVRRPEEVAVVAPPSPAPPVQADATARAQADATERAHSPELVTAPEASAATPIPQEAVASGAPPASEAPVGLAKSAAPNKRVAPGRGESYGSRAPLVEPLPLPLDPQPRAQLSRVPAPLPLELQTDRAEKTATDAVAGGAPSSVAKLNEEASAALLGGHLARAAGLYQQATRGDPSSVSAWRGLALTSERLGRNQEAIHAYNKALELAPSGPQSETLRSRLRNLQSQP
jgi:serine/threonine protein kinase